MTMSAHAHAHARARACVCVCVCVVCVSMCVGGGWEGGQCECMCGNMRGLSGLLLPLSTAFIAFEYFNDSSSS